MTSFALEISLIGPWRPFDPFDPLPGPDLAPVIEQLRTSGLDFPTPRADDPLLLSAVLMEPAVESQRNAPPMIATLFVHEHQSPVPLEVDLVDDDLIVPVREVRRHSVDWPAPDVGPIELHEVSYLIPAPDLHTYGTVVFSTPNLPIADEMEFLFDSIVSTMRWVENE